MADRPLDPQRAALGHCRAAALRIREQQPRAPNVGCQGWSRRTGGVLRTSADSHKQKFTTRTRPSSARSSGVSFSWVITSARRGYPWPRIPSRISSSVRSGFTSRSRGRLSPPPGLGCTCDAGSGGQARGSARRRATTQTPVPRQNPIRCRKSIVSSKKRKTGAAVRVPLLPLHLGYPPTAE